MQWYKDTKSNRWIRLSMYTPYRSLQAQKQHREITLEKHHGFSGCAGVKAEVDTSNLEVLGWPQSHTCAAQWLSQSTLIYARPWGGRGPCFLLSGCCLHLVIFIKMAAISYLNVNYCYDTQDNLTCFGNLFFPLIRWSNWKIFQSVTTVLQVKW